MENSRPILYVATGAHVSDPKGTVTVGTTTIGGMVCREKNKIMTIQWIETLDASKTKHQWDYWENHHMGDWIDTVFTRQPVWGDKSHLERICPQNRTNNWWILGNKKIDVLIKHVIEKIERA